MVLFSIVFPRTDLPAAPAGVTPSVAASSYRNPKVDVESRVSDLLARMTLEEKVSLLAGSGRENGFNTRAIERLGIPELKMTDGPQGVRWESAVAFPSGIAMASTWDPGLVRRLGVALAEETKGRGRHVLLGPCVNIHRLPLGGRNFESFGEDPYLAARIAVGYIGGVQSKGVVATVKHFACNNQEHSRGEVDVTLSERALHEIYFPAFRASIEEAGCWAVMSAYNKVNTFWCAENEYLLHQTLKMRWKFRGLVMSDWGGVHSTAPTLNAGLDIEMPAGRNLDHKVIDEIRNGVIAASAVDDAVRRTLRVIFSIGLFDQPIESDNSQVNSKAHREIARRVAEDGLVLLKNDGAALPLEAGAVERIAVIGPNAAQLRFHGGGSGHAEPVQTVSPLDGIRALAGRKTEVIYAPGTMMENEIDPIEPEHLSPPAGGGARGIRAEYFANQTMEGKPALVRIDPQINFNWGGGSPAPEIPVDHFSARWAGNLTPTESGEYEIVASSDDGIRVFLDGKKILDIWRDHAEEAARARVSLTAGRRYAVRVEYYENGGGAIARLGWNRIEDVTNRLEAAVQAAKDADVAIVFAGLTERHETEGRDRDTLALPAGQDELIVAVSRANPKTIVVLNNGGPLLMDRWLDKAAAVVEAWYPGQEGGAAVAHVLFGRVNPSGKLPMTMPRSWESSPAYGNYPGENLRVEYAEGIYVGYRYFDAKHLEPLFPFGHGLSYTSFEYSNLTVAPGKTVKVSFDIKNTGKREGAEVAQVYVAEDSPRIDRPPKELKAFRKIALAPGKKTRVEIDLGRDAFSYFDPVQRDWDAAAGMFTILVGSSSKDIRLQQKVEYMP